jgi:nucleotidyltransferase/DNA polymerase involved in DNA repair
MRVGCIFFPHFTVQVEARDNDSATVRPIIIGGLSGVRESVYDASQDALECGIRQGMPLREAYSLCPQGLFVTMDEERYADAFTAILTLLANHSPVVEAGTLGSAFIDLSYESSELQLVGELEQLIPERFHLRPSISIAPNKFLSWIASQIAMLGEVIVIPEGEGRAFLEDLPVHLLPASPRTLDQLELLGIYRIGQLASLSLAAVSLEFGSEGERLWNLSNGIDNSGLNPWIGVPILREQIYFEPEVESISQLLASGDELLNRLSLQLKERWQCCLRLTMSLHFSNGHIVQRVFHFKEATSSKETMLHHLRQCLEKARFTAPVGEMRLTLTDFCPEGGRQALLLDEPLKRRERLASAVNWLRQRYGKGVVTRVLTKPNSVLPEDSFSFAEFDPFG